MRYLTTVMFIAVICTLAPQRARCDANSTSSDDRAIVIVLKDGRQHTFPMSEVARIEFKTPTTHAANVGQGRFLGEWKVGDGMGGYFHITLERDGVASKTLGSTHGTWTVVDGEAQITWDDGWRDAIRKVGSRYQKVAFEPGRTFEDQPNHTATAESIERKPI
jgi:hypothetical protein